MLDTLLSRLKEEIAIDGTTGKLSTMHIFIYSCALKSN